ncbi:MAG: DUF805 domain-containing protein [Treponema sp.]|jgi:uncharacterized membrane protein YhaH (DUF805 family)|nr:DUF805 domain-containing protein [Treponema sp.]
MKRLVSLAVIDSGPHNSQEQPPVRRGAGCRKNPLMLFAGAFKKYADFEGRARRAEFWYFVLFNFIIQVVLFVLAGIFAARLENLDDTGSLILAAIFLLYVYLVCMPFIALAVRRIHDADKSGWFALVPVYNIILLFIPGTGGSNRFGPDPKQAEPETPAKIPPGMMILRIVSILAPVWYVGCLAALVIIGNVEGGYANTGVGLWVCCGLLILLFATVHGIAAFLQGIKYQSTPVKILALVDLVLLGVFVFLCVLVLIISKVDKFSLWLSNLFPSLQADAANNIGIGVGIFVGLILFYIMVILPSAMEIWSFRRKKAE